MAVTSSEFITLCQSQVLLWTRSFEATSTVVYLAQQADNTSELSLVPLVAYPETANPWAGLSESLAAITEQPPLDEFSPEFPQSRSAKAGSGTRAMDLTRPSKASGSMQVASKPAWPAGKAPEPPAAAPPLVLPLIHEGVALGVMVSTRETRPWSQEEHQQAEQVANTLALAWVLDQRGQWLQQQLQQRHLTQVGQSDTFHDLLHQFRNPLTALQTFGRLLVKRIPSDDPNQPIAEGIVRESRRLQDLAQTFDSTVTQGDETLQPAPIVPSVTGLLLPGLAAAEADAANSAPLEADPSAPVPVEKLPAGRAAHSWLHLGRAPEMAAGQINEVIAPLLQSTLVIAQERDLVVRQNLPPHLPEVWMDAAALEDVLSNLLDNALKYAPPGALIWVTGGLVQTLDGQFFQGIAIGDTGQGIPLVDQPHIFERHFRGVQSEGEIPGTGLGLAIAQELVQDMGGHLELISPVQAEQWITLPGAEFTQGPGTMFIVWLRTV